MSALYLKSAALHASSAAVPGLSGQYGSRLSPPAGLRACTAPSRRSEVEGRHCAHRPGVRHALQQFRVAQFDGRLGHVRALQAWREVRHERERWVDNRRQAPRSVRRDPVEETRQQLDEQWPRCDVWQLDVAVVRILARVDPRSSAPCPSPQRCRRVELVHDDLHEPLADLPDVVR